MFTRSPRQSLLGVVPAMLAVAGSVAQLPPSTQVCQVRTGLNVDGMGPVNSPFLPSANGAVGTESFGPVAVNSVGYGMAMANVYAAPPLDACMLATDLGLTPYIGCGFLPGDGPALGLPDANYAARVFYSVDLNNYSLPAMDVQVGQGDFGPPVTPFSGIVQGRTAFIIRDGQIVTAPGVAPGTTFGTFNTARVLGVNDSNEFLIAASITESGVAKNAIFKVRTSDAGGVLSQTLVAKEGGPVGAGPATWTNLSVSPVAAAINNSGSVVFSGITSTGEQGVYVDSVAVARTNDPSAVPGQVWGNLLGAPVDINASGTVAIRGPWGDGTVDELADSGETYPTAQASTEGSLNIIRGSLDTDHDVDLYRIRVANFSTFSATTVPGAGFPGCSGDTVLYLFRDFYNGNGITRTVLARSDDAAPGVVQSTLTAANLPPDTTNAAGDYYLGIATPKARPVATGNKEFFQEDPASIAVLSGKVYWSDPGEGTIVRADIASGAIDATYPASVVPAPYVGQTTGTGQIMTPPITVFESGPSRYAYWLTTAYADDRQHRADLNAPTFTIQDTRTTFGQPGDYTGMTGITFDPTSGRIYWSRGDASASDNRGVLNYSNQDGTGGGTLINSSAIGPRPRHLAVHNALRRIYFTENAARRIARVNIDGAAPVVTAVASLTAGLTPTGIAVDAAANKIYWSIASTGTIERCNVDGTGRETYKSGLTSNSLVYYPGSLAIDGGFVYFADVVNRQVVRMTTSTTEPSAQLVVRLPGRTGDRTTDTFSHLDSLSTWTKTGTLSGPALPYQIRLTGALPYYEQAAVVVDGVKIASTGDVPEGTGGVALATVGSSTSPVRLSDTGLAAWRATWGTGNSLVTAIFLGADKVADSNSAVTGSAGRIFRHVKDGPNGFDMSDSGQYLIAATIQRAVPFGETPEFQVNMVAFDSIPTPPPSCIADFNQDGGVDGGDVEAFYLKWEVGDPDADVNQDGGVDGGDVETFFIAWEGGC